MLLGNLIYWVCWVAILLHSGWWSFIRSDGQRVYFVGSFALLVALFMVGVRSFPLNGIH